MDTEASLREYLKVQARVPVIGRIGPLARAFDFVANAAPGVKEILTVGKVCWELRESIEGRADWDLVVVDAAATGHVDQPARRAARDPGAGAGRPDPQPDRLDGRAALRPALTALNVVTAPEEMPVNETIELVAPRPRRSSTCRSASVIVNRVLPELFTHADEAVFEALRAPSPRRGAGASARGRVRGGARRCPPRGLVAPQPLVAPRAAARRGRPAAAALPYLFVRDHGLRVTRMVAEALGQELGY